MNTKSVQVTSLWDNAAVIVTVDEKLAEKLEAIPLRNRKWFCDDVAKLAHEYVTAIEYKKGTTAQTSVSADSIHDIALIRRDYAARLFGTEEFSSEIILLEEGATLAFKEADDYEEQKNWNSPLVILRSEKPSKEDWETLCNFMEEMSGNSPQMIMMNVFGKTPISVKDLEGEQDEPNTH